MNWLQSKLPHFPVSVFSIVMGLSGLTIALSKFYHLQWLPKLLFDMLLGIDFLVFLLLFTLYALKINYFPEEVALEFKHPVRISFFATISISFLLLSIAFYSYWPILAVVLWWIGMLAQTTLTFLTIRFWIQNDYEIKNCNPAWFIPVVGNILIPILGVDLLPKEISLFFYAIGMFFWVILFTVIFYRLIFHSALPEKLVPTLVIFIAPAAVGFISYMRIAQSWDIISMGLLALTYFFIILLGTMVKDFLKLPFTLSWWAFTFPMAAATIASTVAFQVTHNQIFQYVSWALLTITALIISVVLVTTIKHVKSGTVCIPES